MRRSCFTKVIATLLSCLTIGCTSSVSNERRLTPPIISSAVASEHSRKEANEIVLCVDLWDGLTNADDTGSYAELVKAVYEPAYRVKIKHFPWARAQAEFKNERCDGLIAESKIDDNYIKPKIILDALELEIYFLKGRQKYQGSKSLSSQRIAWLRGYNFHKLVDYPIQLVEINDVKAGYKMLEGGRFDFLLDYSYTFKDECETSGADCSRITSQPSGVIEKVWVVFHRTKVGSTLADHWDHRMPLLIQDGIPQKIFKRYGQTYPGP